MTGSDQLNQLVNLRRRAMLIAEAEWRGTIQAYVSAECPPYSPDSELQEAFRQAHEEGRALLTGKPAPA